MSPFIYHFRGTESCTGLFPRTCQPSSSWGLQPRADSCRSSKGGRGKRVIFVVTSRLHSEPGQDLRFPKLKSHGHGEQTAQACANAWLHQLSVNSKRRGRISPTIAASRTPPSLLSGWGCRGRRLSRG